MINYENIFIKLKRILYPTGRAWNLKKGSIFERLHRGLSVSEAEVTENSKGLLNSILPDNDNFSEEDALNWERALGLPEQPDLDLETRKLIITEKINYPNNLLARQHYKNFEGFLRARGFDVYVHENRFPDGGGGFEVFDPRGAQFNTFKFGELKYSQSSISGGYEVCANYIDDQTDSKYIIGNDVNLRATFFIGGEIFPDRANVDLLRKEELRQLILQLKPCQTVAFLLLNYTGDNQAEFTDGSAFQFTDGTNLEYTEI